MTTPENSTNPLFDNLVPATPATRSSTRLSFADAMPRMGMRSVFDIIRQPKQAFTRQLRTLSDADGEMAYENAMCYATQIARSFRDDVVSSGRSIAQTSQRSGVRALVDIGPSYPNLFRENWDEFCKVGAIEAMDGPVAYLGSLRRFAEREIEDNADGQTNITLAIRRPDLDALVIDERSTYQPVPMLDLVNDVLTQGIDKYQKEKNDVRPIHTLLAEKKHPFVFPYHFAHKQVSLALSGDKPGLGELNARLALPFAAPLTQPIKQGGALALLSGLNPAQQLVLTRATPFAAFNRGVNATAAGYSPILSNTHLWAVNQTHLEVPAQASVISKANQSNYTLIEMRLNQANGADTKVVKLRASGLREGSGGSWVLSQKHSDLASGLCITLSYNRDDNPDAPLTGDYFARLLLDVVVTVDGKARKTRQLSFDINTADDDGLGRPLTESEGLYWTQHFGTQQAFSQLSDLRTIKTFCDATGVSAEQLEALLGEKGHAPRLSPNCPIGNRTGGTHPLRTFINSTNYGACYVNGNGAVDAFAPPGNHGQYNNAMCFEQPAQSDKNSSHLLYTSLDRFDRLQRMIRLQQWTGLPFPELDTLIVSAMRAEGDHNPGLHANTNTLRMLGAYRYFNEHYGIGAEEFAAFVHDITPFACGDRLPLFDRVFNSPVLLGSPLRMDQSAFSLATDDRASQTTVNQLCAGLGLAPTEDSFGLVAAATVAHVGSLKRSLTVVSSLYRQARLAALFGLSVADLHTALNLLGGTEYLRVITAGGLAEQRDDGAQMDVLDVMMQLDRFVRWAKVNKLTVQPLASLLAAPSASLKQPELDRLRQLALDTLAMAITPAAIKALSLPAVNAAQQRIDWPARLQSTGYLKAGLVYEDGNLQFEAEYDLLRETLHSYVIGWGLKAEDVEPAFNTLADFLVDAMARQHRLFASCLHDLTGMLPDCALAAARHVGAYTYDMLLKTLQAWGSTAESPAHVQELEAILCPALHFMHAIAWAKTGTEAVRLFVAQPQVLGEGRFGLPLHLSTLHGLKTYDNLFNTLGQPEERLLGYLQQANTSVSKRPGKRQLAVQSQACNADLASLLGWSETEVAVLTALLPQGIAKTVAHVDWLRRAQALALETGLSTATLVQACALTADSPEADWQAVGQAAMAAAI